ncbi:hypothetical protein JYK00_00590 [Thermosipho ferrireducens]|uniref:Uncharacterized protein n=1 Tax=Thermosipho ferrireducens TaxID=2571116 RepID=A0ABX7S675_9BACT|nr:hypothetical protein [Thermosipho ferrireducens]QTA38081.1 hypothetical protein JYK00_00590 [Thermosipho ferrireducens]
MKKFLLFSIFLVSLTVMASFSPSFSLKVTFTLDYTNDYPVITPVYYWTNEFWISGNIFEKDYDLSFSLKDNQINSAKIAISQYDSKITIFKNQKEGSTGDWLSLYIIDYPYVDSGQDGVYFNYSGLNVVLFNTLDLRYLQFRGSSFSTFFGKRGSLWDFYLDYYLKFSNFNVIGEVVQTGILSDFSNLSIEKMVFLGGIVEKNWNSGIKYVFFGNNVEMPYSPTSFESSHNLDIWSKMGNFTVALKPHFDIDTIVDDFIKRTEIFVDFSNDSIFINLFKKGIEFDDIANPTTWGEFSVTFGTNYSLFGFNGKLSYTFGNPAHNTVRTIGDVYYLELSKSIGNITLFTKFQRIVGYYETRNTFYGELKFTGFSSGELIVKVGNDDFYNVNNFKKVVNIEFNTWW